jgi:hypothetical protein
VQSAKAVQKIRFSQAAEPFAGQRQKFSKPKVILAAMTMQLLSEWLMKAVPTSAHE